MDAPAQQAIQPTSTLETPYINAIGGAERPSANISHSNVEKVV